MLKIIESDIVQSIDAIKEQYPNSKLVIRQNENDYEYGYILAVSESPDSYDALCEYVATLPTNIVIYLAGDYMEGGTFGVLHEVD